MSQFIEMFDINEDNHTRSSLVPFANCVSDMTKGPFGSDIKKSLYVPKSESAYKVYIQINAIEKNESLGDYYISKEYFDSKMHKFEVRPGDYIITCDGTLGKYIQIPDNAEKGIISASLLRLTLKDMMLPRYFEFLWDVYMLPTLLKEVRNTALKHLPSATKIGEMPIPLPNLLLQKRFSDIARQADKSGFVSLKSQFIEMFGNPLASIQKYPLKKLGECCKLNPRRPSLDLEDTDKVSFVPMPSVSENGYLQDVIDEEYGKVKKGFTYFKNNDVLFAKITPCMENGKGAIAEGLTNNIGMGSTEFHVLRPIEGKSNPFWLLALTRLPIFRERATKNMSGTGGQKRVPATYLENFMVGLPPIEEQNRFENIFNQADKSGYGYGFKLAS